MSVIDLRDELAREEWSIGTSEKASATCHWPGTSDRIDDPLGALFGYAEYHVSKDWSPEPGITGGDGIQYRAAFDQAGNTYILRDHAAVLWHCDNAFGNATSIPYLLLLAIGEEPSAAMKAAVVRQAREDAVTVLRPHGPYWVATQCPGDQVRAWLATGPAMEEDEMDRATFDRWFRENYESYGFPTTFKSIETVLDDHAKLFRAGGYLDQQQEQHLRDLQGELQRLRDHLAAVPQ